MSHVPHVAYFYRSRVHQKREEVEVRVEVEVSVEDVGPKGRPLDAGHAVARGDN